jgi:hypothetical protein
MTSSAGPILKPGFRPISRGQFGNTPARRREKSLPELIIANEIG